MTGLLLSYYLGGVAWALQRGRRQAFPHTLLVPVALLAAWRNRWPSNAYPARAAQRQ